jgi:hypothetical protein
MYYSAADAKKMGMKDAMGHKLMAMRMTSANKMGMKMAKMGKMSGDKMSGGKNERRRLTNSHRPSLTQAIGKPALTWGRLFLFLDRPPLPGTPGRARTKDDHERR